MPQLLPCLLALSVAALAADKPSASGTFVYGETKYTPAHAVAFHEGTFVKVVLSDKALDPALGKDGAYTESDLMAHPSATLTITFGSDDRQLSGIRVRNHQGSGADLRCEGPGLLKVDKMDTKAVTGSFKCEGHDLRFEAPMLGPPKK